MHYTNLQFILLNYYDKELLVITAISRLTNPLHLLYELIQPFTKIQPCGGFCTNFINVCVPLQITSK